MSTCNSSSSSFKIYSKYKCKCGYPARIWTSTTEAHPGKKFRQCPNALNPKKSACNYWKWDDEEEPILQNDDEVRIEILEGDLQMHKVMFDNEVKKLKEDVSDLQKKVSLQRSIMFMLVILFAVKGFLGL